MQNDGVNMNLQSQHIIFHTSFEVEIWQIRLMDRDILMDLP